MTPKNRVPHPRPVGEEFFLRYCASTPLEEYSSGMCVVFAERVSEISFRDDLDRRALALEPLAFRSLRRTLRISTGLNASRRRPRSQPSSTPRSDATSARFDSFYHALLISQRELSRQDERFALASTGSLASSGTLI